MSTTSRITAALAATAALALPVVATQAGQAPLASAATTSSSHVIDLRAHPQDLVTFASPTGNITCQLDREAGGYTVRCDVAHATWKTPRTKCGPMAFGDSVYATATRTGLTCHTDTLNGGARLGGFGTEWASTTAGRRLASHAHGNATLPYGTTILVSRTAGCTSRTTGVSCWNGNKTVTQHFTVARNSYNLHR